MLSPNDNIQQPNKASLKESSDHSDNRAVGLLLALSNGENSNKVEKSPARDVDSNSNSALSSPETPLSSACLLVQAAVEPLEQGFKFPKTKKGLMNEWLNKMPEPVQTASAMSPSSLTPQLGNIEEMSSNVYTPMKSVSVPSDLNLHPRGSAKKRWLRQAISEDHSCDSPTSRPDSPPLSDMVAPPKKRRLPRESLSTDTSPPNTPTGSAPAAAFINPLNDRVNLEGCVEIVYNGSEGDSPIQTLESDIILKERAAKMKQEFAKSMMPATLDLSRPELGPLSCLDPRLSRDGQMFNTDLVGTVEKTLSILGLENSNPQTPVLPKRKLSITEYRQRKKLNVNDKNDEMMEPEQSSLEENNSSESFRVTSRLRSASASSSTSLSSSDDEAAPADLITKTSAFNSEPTELEREREIASLRLKKAFGLAVDGEPRPALNVEAILNLELEPPKIKPTLPLLSPTFPIPGSSEMVPRDLPPPNLAPSPEHDSSSSSMQLPPLPTTPPVDVEDMETEEISVTDDNPPAVMGDSSSLPDSGKGAPTLYYTPDEEEVKDEGEGEEEVQPEAAFEETESISYVPPFNNPVYPNESFTAFSSAIDDDARYEGRNPSPPPNLEKSEFEEQA
ncbi:hypothetical protein JTB14_021895 [Gonioctena quinquepunctata]|nr:hypothetical protein JTB14_021895 [Gonioctena quinquepunctata]